MMAVLWSLSIFCHIFLASGSYSSILNQIVNKNFKAKCNRFSPCPNTQYPRPIDAFVVDRDSMDNSNEERETYETSTYTEKEFTTEPFSTENGPRIQIQCPDGQSALTEKDLNDTINFFAEKNKIIEVINGSYFELAKSLRDKHAKTKNDFLEWFHNSPSHLRHILDDVAQMKNVHIEPLVKKIVSKIPEIALLRNKFEEQLNSSNVWLKKFEMSKRLCELNCDTQEFEKRGRRDLIETEQYPMHLSSSDRYCNTLEGIKNKISVTLSEFEEEYTKTLRHSLNEIDHSYKENIDQLKSDMKEAAVQKFGSVMYDVLSLEDEFHHFSIFLKDENGENGFDSYISNVRKNNIQIDLKLEEFRNCLQKYKKYCLSCHDEQQRYRRDVSDEYWQTDTESYDVPTTEVHPTEIPTTEVPTTEIPTTEVPTTDLLEQLLYKFIGKTKVIFQMEIDYLFEDINDILNDKDKIIQNTLSELKPMLDKIVDDKKNEDVEINALKRQVPESLFNELKQINEETKSLQNNLEDAVELMQRVVRI